MGTGEGAFVPTNEYEFMRMTPLWRLMLGDLAEAIERNQQHAAVEYFRWLDWPHPGRTMGQRLCTHSWAMARSAARRSSN